MRIRTTLASSVCLAVYLCLFAMPQPVSANVSLSTSRSIVIPVDASQGVVTVLVSQQHCDYSYHFENDYDCIHHNSVCTSPSYSAASTVASESTTASGHLLQSTLSRQYGYDYDEDACFLLQPISLVAPGSRGIGKGARAHPGTVLDEDQIARLTREFDEIGGDASKLRFNNGKGTGYVDADDVINVRGDVLPSTNPGVTHPRSTMTSRAALAHEWGHQAHRGTRLKPGAWNDEFRASYTAATKAKNLTDAERASLIMDAMERANEAGITMRMNATMRRILYGY